jgi:ribosomal protein S18 acetylase RimI-like enzyme
MPTDAAMLRSIGVLISERGSGAAFALLEAFERIAYERGSKQVYLTTDGNDNERAQNFYKRHGYLLVKSFQQDKKRLMWLMSKTLRRFPNE